jgi:hypothetical protein
MAKPTEPKTPEAPKEPAKAEETATESEFDLKVAKAVAAAMAKAMPAMGTEMAKAFGTAMMAAESVKAQTEHDKILAATKRKLAKEEKCHICRQVVGDGKNYGCGGPWKRDPKTNAFITEPLLNPDGTPAMDFEGKPVLQRIEDPNQFHMMKVVYPQDPLAAEWFMGVIINGALYQSMGPEHKIWVPKKSDIDSLLSVYTQNEIEQRVGRKHVRRNGGTLSGRGGSNTAPIGAGFS